MVRSEKDVFGNFFMKNNFYLVATGRKLPKLKRMEGQL
jgi:hypothetical protein